MQSSTYLLFMVVAFSMAGSVANNIFTIRTIELKENTVIVVLGASGDLAKKKTVRPTRTCE